MSKVNWVVFTPWTNSIKFNIDEDIVNEVYVDKDDFELVQSLIEYLKGWEGCEIYHLLEHWDNHERFKGSERNKRFVTWISKYPALFSCEPYEESKAVKWIGMRCQLMPAKKRRLGSGNSGRNGRTKAHSM